MSEQDIFNNPAFQNLTPEKLEFLKRFQNTKQSSSTSEMAALLMNAINTSRQEKINFSSQETDLLFTMLKSQLPPEEQAKADMIYRMVNQRKK
jgi:uncharacterized protein YfkK (UPF0435 family)